MSTIRAGRIVALTAIPAFDPEDGSQTEPVSGLWRLVEPDPLEWLIESVDRPGYRVSVPWSELQGQVDPVYHAHVLEEVRLSRHRLEDAGVFAFDSQAGW